MNRSTRPRTIWLTGASSGIGKALLERLVGEGHQVVATARSPEQLESFRQQWGDAVIPLAADTRSREDMERCGRFLQTLPRLDWAILNAGTCEYLDVKAFSADLVERVFATNVVGTARCIEAALPALRQSANGRGHPRLAVVSSSAWWFPFTRAEAYGGSKAALTYFAQSLRADLAAEGIARIGLVAERPPERAVLDERVIRELLRLRDVVRLDVCDRRLPAQKSGGQRKTHALMKQDQVEPAAALVVGSKHVLAEATVDDLERPRFFELGGAWDEFDEQPVGGDVRRDIGGRRIGERFGHGAEQTPLFERFQPRGARDLPGPPGDRIFGEHGTGRPPLRVLSLA